jgi:hypothetical protein
VICGWFMRFLALLRLLIREIAAAGKGLLWRNFLLSIALEAPMGAASVAPRGQIGFNTFHSQSKEFNA